MIGKGAIALNQECVGFDQVVDLIMDHYTSAKFMPLIHGTVFLKLIYNMSVKDC